MQNVKTQLSSIELKSQDNALKWSHADGKINVACKWALPNFQESRENQIVSPEFTAGDNDELKWQLELDPVCTSVFCCIGRSMHLRVNFIESSNIKYYFKISTLDKALKEVVAKNYEEDLVIDRTDSSKNHVKLKLDSGNQLSNCFTILLKILAVQVQPSSKSSNEWTLIPEPSTSQSNGQTNNVNLFEGSEQIQDDLNDFEKLLENGIFSDIMLIMSNGKCLKAHKNILAARSPIFFEMLSPDSKKNIYELEVKDVDYEIMKAILCFIYTGKVHNLKEEAVNLLIAANKFAIQTLSFKCEQVLCKNINAENAFEYLQLADSCKANKLKTRAIEVIMENLSKYGDTQFKTLTHTLLVDVLSSLSKKQNFGWNFNNPLVNQWKFGNYKNPK